MCGRIGFFHGDRDLLPLFRVANPEGLVQEPRYNIAPTQLLTLIFLSAKGERRAGRARWGLVPRWANSPSEWKASTFNARSEDVETKPTFREAFRRGRVLIPASGFYEWKREEDGSKTPHFIQRRSSDPLAFAGLMDVWRSRDGDQRLVSCTILTTNPNALMAPLHDRMPVVLAVEDFDLWLDRSTPTGVVGNLLRSAPDQELEAFPVSTAVNRVGQEGAELVRPLGR